jgi:type II secretory pathway pseudopilin PulG
MIDRLLREESGVALGLAVILVVLIGVLAAALLAVLRSDLEGTVQANRGQRALHLADAGAQAAAAHLRADATPEHYDADGAENSDWAQAPPDGQAPGKTLTLDEDAATVSVRYLLPATTDAERSDKLHAPEKTPTGLDDYPDRDFFLVVSEGSSGGTRRKVEAIVYAKASGDAREIVQWSWREVYE